MKMVKLMAVVLVMLLLLPTVPSGVVLAQNEDWKVDMSITTEPLIGAVDILGFGAKDGATDAWVVGDGDVIAPPPPIAGVAAYFYYPHNLLFTRKLGISIVAPAETIAWPLVIRVIGGEDALMTISWSAEDIAKVPPKYTLELQDTAGRTLVDMRDVGSHTFSVSPATVYRFNVVAQQVVPPPRYILTFAIDPPASGTVTLTPPPGADGRYARATEVTLTATPAAGFTFSRWTGDATGTLPTVSIAMGRDKSVTAHFAAVVVVPPRYILTVTVDPTDSGTVNLNPEQPAEGYLEGTEVTLTATPAEGFRFARWSGDLIGTEPTTTLTMDTPKSVTAHFAAVVVPPPPRYTLTVTVDPPASGTVSLDPLQPEEGYLAGTEVTLTAVPAEGFRFDRWSGDLIGTDPAMTLTMDAPKSVTAHFAVVVPRHILTVTIDPPASGTVTLNPLQPDEGYEAATVVTLTAVPAEVFRFDRWSGDLIGTDPAMTLTMDAPKSVTAHFEEMPQVMFYADTFMVVEDAGYATITVVLSQTTRDTVTVDFATVADGTATTGQDYTAISGTLTFAPGKTIQTFTVTIRDDELVEGNETVNLTLSNPINAVLGTPDKAVLTIDDDEMPQVRFYADTFMVAEDAGYATITVVLSQATLDTVTVDFATVADGTATTGQDYTAISGTLTFAPGETRQTFTVTILDDELVEGNETVNLTLSNPINAVLGTPDKAVLTIDDDEMPQVMFVWDTYMVFELYPSYATITVMLSQATLDTVTVDFATVTEGTATTGQDYTAISGTLMFAPGETTQTFTVTILDDENAEGNETVNLVLRNATNATLGTPYQAVLIIRDDESWLFRWDRVALIAPHPMRGREFLTRPVALTDVNFDGPADGWFQVLWFDEDEGRWYAFYSGFTGGNTLTYLKPGEFYYVVVSHPDTSLWTDGGW